MDTQSYTEGDSQAFARGLQLSLQAASQADISHGLGMWISRKLMQQDTFHRSDPTTSNQTATGEAQSTTTSLPHPPPPPPQSSPLYNTTPAHGAPPPPPPPPTPITLTPATARAQDNSPAGPTNWCWRSTHTHHWHSLDQVLAPSILSVFTTQNTVYITASHLTVAHPPNRDVTARVYVQVRGLHTSNRGFAIPETHLSPCTIALHHTTQAQLQQRIDVIQNTFPLTLTTQLQQHSDIPWLGRNQRRDEWCVPLNITRNSNRGLVAADPCIQLATWIHHTRDTLTTGTDTVGGPYAYVGYQTRGDGTPPFFHISFYE
jgi:hypothetical protein